MNYVYCAFSEYSGPDFTMFCVIDMNCMYCIFCEYSEPDFTVYCVIDIAMNFIHTGTFMT